MELQSGFKTWKAYAKVNLTLEVIGKRDDGYHEIVSVVQAIDLYDVLSFQPREHIYLSSNIPELASPNNLVLRAAKLLQDYTSSGSGVAICLEKAIPLTSGMGGGSSDAATTLRALNEIWRLNLTSEDLGKIALSLGSDISFFLQSGGTALVEGRGDKVTRLPSLIKTWIVLMKPPIDVPGKTRRMYAKLAPSHFTTGRFSQRMVQLLHREEKITSSFCHNVFEDIAFFFFHGLEEYWNCFLAAGAEQVHLAGAGPTLFTLVEEKAKAEEICRRLEKEGMDVYLAETL